MRAITDLTSYTGVLPFASELYGVYQPLLGWKSSAIKSRFSQAGASPILDLLLELTRATEPRVTFDRIATIPNYLPDGTLDYYDISFQNLSILPGTLSQSAVRTATLKDSIRKWSESEPRAPFVSEYHGFLPGGGHGAVLLTLPATVLLQRLLDQALEKGFMRNEVWAEICSEDNLTATLKGSTDELLNTYGTDLGNEGLIAALPAAERTLRQLIGTCSRVAGAVKFLADKGMFDILRGMFDVSSRVPILARVENLFKVLDPLEHFNPQEDAGQVSLSPIGIVHLYRQFFFELDTFLGSPVQHIWLPPGSSIELYESHTRRSLEERFVERLRSEALRAESSRSELDEFSAAIHEDNESSTKLGVSVSSGSSFAVSPAFTSQVGTTASFDLSSTAKTTREQGHKQTRQQSDKIASEMRSEFRTTFRTTTETLDVSSRRYVIENRSEGKLANYELRRKMRQVAVQLQDVGTQLCWQTYVDTPGDELGLADLVHIAKPADLSSVPDPSGPPAPEVEIRGTPVRVDVVWSTEDQVGPNTFVGISPLLAVTPPKPGYVYNRSQIIVVSGEPWLFGAEVKGAITADGEIQAQSVILGVITGPGGIITDEHPRFTLEWTPIFKPSFGLLLRIQQAAARAEAGATEALAREHKKAFFEAARDRIKLAGDIRARPFEDLREEERIIVYRNLIRQLLKSVRFDLLPSQAQSKTRHVMAELIQSMFDVDKMLYYVAPEWWAPRVHDRSQYQQTVNPGAENEQAGRDFQHEAVVEWGGARSKRPDNYLITEGSTAARLGSSLGWLLQLDGDNLRNAFLNAPWVKAVIPIRPGKELAATNWLANASVEGADGLDDLFTGAAGERAKLLVVLQTYSGWRSEDLDGSTTPPNARTLEQRYHDITPEQLTIRDVIRALAIQVKQKAERAAQQATTTDGDPVGYLPTDKVFEKGFDPLQGGFNASSAEFAVFDQWIEVLPTDQVAAVEVTYNPRTGRQE